MKRIKSLAPVVFMFCFLLASCVVREEITQGVETETEIIEEGDVSTEIPETQMAESPSPISISSTPTENPGVSNRDVALNPDGPWFSFLVEVGYGVSRLYITNPDGSGKVQLVTCSSCSSPVTSKTGRYIAYVRTNYFPTYQDDKLPVLELVIIELPSLAEVEVINLISNDGVKEIQDLGQSDLFRIARWSRPGWSPDGTSVAFSATIDAPNNDLYIFNVIDKELTRLSTGPNHAADPYWSPDGKLVIHREIVEHDYEGEENDVGLWAANVETGENWRLYVPNGRDVLRGWVDEQNMVTYAHRWVRSHGPEVDIRVTNVYSGTSQLICHDSCEPQELIIDQPHRLVVYQRRPFTEWYLLTVDNWRITRLPELAGLYPPVWNDEIQGWVFVSPDYLSEIDCEGEIGHYYLQNDQTLGCTTIKIRPFENPSPDGRWSVSSDTVLTKDDQVVLRYLDDPGFHNALSDGISDFFQVIWREDSSGVFLFTNTDLYYVEIPDNDPKRIHSRDFIWFSEWIGKSD